MCLPVSLSVCFSHVRFCVFLFLAVRMCIWGLLLHEVHWTLSLFLQISKQWTVMQLRVDTQTHISCAHTLQGTHRKHLIRDRPLLPLEVSICWICDWDQKFKLFSCLSLQKHRQRRKDSACCSKSNTKVSQSFKLLNYSQCVCLTHYDYCTILATPQAIMWLCDTKCLMWL